MRTNKRAFSLRCLLTFACALVAMIVSASGLARPAAYYVDPAGDNANSGTLESPWATPGYGSRQLRPGDTLIIREGRYVLKEFDADILTPASGTPDLWVVIRGEAGTRPVLAGRDNLAAAIDLSGASYVRIENLEITHDDTVSGQSTWFRDGLVIVDRPAAHIVLKSMYIHHLDEFGINIQDVDDLKIEDCRILYCGFGAVGGPAGEHGGVRNLVISGSELSWSGHYYQGGDGSDRPYDRPDGFGLEASSGPIEIVNTRAEHNYGDGLDSKAENTYIRNCVVAHNTCDGIKIWGDGSRVENSLIYGRGDGDSTRSPWASLVIDQVEKSGAGFEIVNCTIHDPLEGYPAYFGYDQSVPITLLLRNTILVGNEAPLFVGAMVSLTLDHSIVYIPLGDTQITTSSGDYTSAEIEAGSLGAGNLSRDPLFVQSTWTGTGDYRLRSSSHAIDAGTATGAPALDLGHRTRPQGTGYDMGAYEFHSVPAGLFSCEAREICVELLNQPSQVRGGERFQSSLHLAVDAPQSYRRASLYIAVSSPAGELFFLSEDARQPVIRDAAPFQTLFLDEAEIVTPVLDFDVPQGAVGEYTLFAVLSETGETLAVDRLLSNLAMAVVYFVPP